MEEPAHTLVDGVNTLACRIREKVVELLPGRAPLARHKIRIEYGISVFIEGVFHHVRIGAFTASGPSVDGLARFAQAHFLNELQAVSSIDSTVIAAGGVVIEVDRGCIGVGIIGLSHLRRAQEGSAHCQRQRGNKARDKRGHAPARTAAGAEAHGSFRVYGFLHLTAPFLVTPNHCRWIIHES